MTLKKYRDEHKSEQFDAKPSKLLLKRMKEWKTDTQNNYKEENHNNCEQIQDIMGKGAKTSLSMTTKRQ